MPYLHRPTRLAEATRLLGGLADAMVYGGGTAIQILAKQGLLFAEHLIDIALVPGLNAIAETSNGLRVGPMVTLREMERSPLVHRLAPLAADTYSRVANPRVRNTASVGGNIAHGDYRLDPPTALMVLDARIELTSVRGTRAVPVREFFLGFQTTAVQPGELITAIEIPRQPAGSSFAYAKLSALSANDWPSASAAAILRRTAGAGTLLLGLGALAPVPLFVQVDVTGLALAAAQQAALEVVEPRLAPIADVRGGVGYKKELGRVAVADAVRRAWEGAPDES